MTAKVVDIRPLQKSKINHGYFHYVFFKGVVDGKRYKSCIFNTCDNYGKWKGIKVGMVLGNLSVKNKELVNADSCPKIIDESGVLPNAREIT